MSWRLALFYYLVSLPMWGWLIFVIAMNSGGIPTPAILTPLQHWLLYLLTLIVFIVDHLPNNWREFITKVKMISAT